jgi:DNA-binding MarR family transcriptional regulator
MDEKEMAKAMADLTCELAKTCFEKEKYFAALFNLTTAEYKCLRLFTNTTSKSIKEISLEMNLTPGRITHILTSLEAKKLIERRVDPSDRRNVIVYLTNKSKPFLNNLNESYVKIHEELLKNIEQKKREIVINSMNELLKALKSWRDKVD